MVILLLGLGTALNPAFWSQAIMPNHIRGKFLANADIVPAAKEENALFVSVNPNFRAQFGDKNNPHAAFLRFAAVAGQLDGKINNAVSLNPFENTAQVISALGDQEVAGVELTLISASLRTSDPKSLGNSLGEDEELLRLAREMLGESNEVLGDSELTTAQAQAEKIQTQTVAQRENGLDVVKNLAVAPDVDINYTLRAGQGITTSIVLGDRQGFDVACLSALSQGMSELCDLPRNYFSFLLTLDPGLQLEKSLVSLDSGTRGSYFISDSQGNYVMRLQNPAALDKAGNVLSEADFALEPAQLGGEVVPGFYIMTVELDLNWLTAASRSYPVTVTSGFYVNHGDLLQVATE